MDTKDNNKKYKKYKISIKNINFLFSDFINSFSDDIYISNDKNEVVLLNKTLEEKTGKNIEGEKCYKAIFNKNEICKWCAKDKLNGQKKINYEIPYPINNRYYKLNASSLDDKNTLFIFKDITELKRTIEERNENLLKFKTLYNYTPIAFQSLDEKGNIIDVNPRWLEILGYEKKEVLNKNFIEFIHDDYKKNFTKKFIEFKNKGYIKNVEFIMLKKNEEHIYATFDGRISYNEEGTFKQTYSTFKDITKLKEAEDKIKQDYEELTEDNRIIEELLENSRKQNEELSEDNRIIEELLENSRKQNEEIELNNQRLKSLLKISNFQGTKHDLLEFALQEAIILTQSKIGYIYFYNEKTKQFKLNSWSKEVMQRCSSVEPKTENELDKIGIWGEVVRQRKPIMLNDYKAPNKLKKGHPKDHIELIRFLSIPIFRNKQIVAVLGVGNKKSDYNEIDIEQLELLMESVWKILEKQELLREIKKAKEKAEESNLLKTEFLHNMSHEIRTPMNAIIGFSDLLLDNNIDQKSKKQYLNIIINSGNQLIRIIDDILEISRLETKKVKVIKERINLNNLYLQIYGAFSKKARDLNLSFYLSKFLADDKCFIITDQNKLEKILSNLVDNALKYTNKGFVELGYKVNSEELICYVKDSGIGIDKNKKEYIFERFSRLEEDHFETIRGLGLGLAIVKENAELLEAKIDLQSEKGKGTLFKIKFPLEKVELLPDIIEQKTEKKYKILIVEDDDLNMLYLQTILSELAPKAFIFQAINGEQAIDIVKKNDIDLILMDIKLPKKSGIEITKEIKLMKPNIKIIAQTAYSSQEEKNIAISAGCEDFISKPISKNTLQFILNKHFMNYIN